MTRETTTITPEAHYQETYDYQLGEVRSCNFDQATLVECARFATERVSNLPAQFTRDYPVHTAYERAMRDAWITALIEQPT